ncbi:uncharacterized protein LOC121386467 [Gigantopelta aegis]|uniref:uncharacterized protein LOC121386467 n=1 Tax=Gigantopelta aegis TaxID=1735272 RepID=UPI001B88DC09|nr:uncharacterized protein LOC121386467 [Gigantopelta aegis]
MPGQCHFQASWLDIPDFKDWLQKVVRDARCIVCVKTISLKNQGITACKIHVKGQKHNKAMEDKRKTIPGFFSPRSTSETVTTIAQYSLPSSKPAEPSTSIGDASLMAPRPLVCGNQTLKAEILWALKCVDSHFSFHSCEHISDIFKQMFPGDPLAQTFSCGETKCRYICQFGIAPYFHGLLKESARADGDYVLLFDESLNKVKKNKQMDILLRLWHHDQVRSRYFTSKFIGHASAQDMLDHFNSAIEDLNHTGILQVSMDGPSVNW